MEKKFLSIIIPSYNEEKTILTLFERLKKVETRLFHYIVNYIFIDDGSYDNTLKCIEKMASNNEKIIYISFSKNFGKEAAILAGLEHADGDYVAIMDADLQDPPELLIKMMAEFENDNEYDCIAARRVTRKGEPIIRSFFARIFYKIFNKLSDIEIADGARDFRVMNRNMVNAILMLKEKNRFSKGLFSWVGFKTKWMEFENIERSAGETKWSFAKLITYSLEGIMSFSTIPLQLASWLGMILCVISALVILIIIVSVLAFHGDPVQGRPTLLCVIMFLGGVQLLSIGILGQYIGKMFIEIKNRPNYIIKKSNIELEKQDEKIFIR